MALHGESGRMWLSSWRIALFPYNATAIDKALVHVDAGEGSWKA
jgi:hypothetical protein